MMLSRIAESLFWLGRYIERAEDTSRILEVQLQQRVEDLSINEHISGYSLFRAMGHEAALVPGQTITDQLVMETFAYDPNSPASMVTALSNGRENARRIRETISVELWESINTSFLAITGPQFRQLRPFVAFREVRERCQVIFGSATQTMIHDDSWNFLRLGRAIERADMTARLVSVAAVDTNSQVGWSNALRACGAHHAYVRAFGGDAVGTESAAFLLLHHQFPRSLVYTLNEAETALRELHAKRRTMLIEDPAALLLGRARSDLEYQPAETLTTELGQRMVRVQEACADASAAISKRYFEGATADEWFGGIA